MSYALPTCGRELLEDPLFRAAECRAKGWDWQRTAKEVGVDYAELRSLSLDYPDRWKELYDAAQNEFFQDIGREGCYFARHHLRDEDPKVSLKAVAEILHFFAAVRRHSSKEERASGEFPMLKAFQGLSHDFFQGFYERKVAENGGRVVYDNDGDNLTDGNVIDLDNNLTVLSPSPSAGEGLGVRGKVAGIPLTPNPSPARGEGSSDSRNSDTG